MTTQQVDQFSDVLGRALVGAVAAFVVRKALKRNLLGIIVGTVVVMVVHEFLDAPVSRAISALRQ